MQHAPPFGGTWRGARVLVTGHTGFKGAWLCEWLLALGAEVTGYSLGPPTDPALFDQLGLAVRLSRHLEGDVRDRAALDRALREARPEAVLHLAAQSLVRRSYAEPQATFEVNTLGTVNLMEALRAWGRPCVAVVITTDKCYENREWLHGYRETDPLGGRDPYSASKAAAELVVAAYRESFFAEGPVRVASARAGNVIGGGDWAADRIMSDCVRALRCGQPIRVRNPRATRPWQHVLEPLSGYLWLAAQLRRPEAQPRDLCSAFNFGPGYEANRTVGELVDEILKHWPGTREEAVEAGAPHEAGLLLLSTDKAAARLKWRGVWGFAESVARTIAWYRHTEREPATAGAFTAGQIAAYVQEARTQGLPWAIAPA